MKPIDEKKLYLISDDVCKCVQPVKDRSYLKHSVCKKCNLFIVKKKKV